MKKLLIRITASAAVIAIILTGSYFLLPGAVIKAGYQAARWKAGVEVKHVTIGNYNWAYLEGGEGETIVLLHGFGVNKDLWGELPAALTKNYRVIIPDLPGFGENSQIETDRYDLASQVKRVREFTAKIGLDHFSIIGLSMGGGIAALYASEYPDSVKSLILMDAVGMDTPVVSDFEKMVSQGEKPLIFMNVEQYDKMIDLVFYVKPVTPAHIKKYLAGRGAKNYSFHDKVFNDLKNSGLNLENRLRNIKARTLIMWGEKDRIFDVSDAYAFKKGVNGSKLVIIPGSGHVVILEKPDESVKAVTDFLASK